MNAHTALIVIDVQNCFCSGGNLAVAGGEQVVPLINRLASRFENVVITQDWHPRGHISFASSHAGKRPYDRISLPYGEQVLWPDHAVPGTLDAALHADLAITHAQLLIRKGYHAHTDSYSAFMEADGITPTGLAGYLAARGIHTVYLCGLATDFCVAASAVDARRAGLQAVVIEDACRAIDLDGSLAATWARMTEAGARRVASADVLGQPASAALT